MFPLIAGKEMTLRQKQSYFVVMVSHLINYAYENGYELTFGDALAFNLRTFVLSLLKPLLSEKRYKNLLARAHSKLSFHYKRLAIDFNLFKDGKFLTETEDHYLLGQYWISMGGTWGGDFKRKDGNHYSFGEH